MPRTVGYTTIPRDGLVGEWLLDGNANDTSGLGHNGTATNITYVSSDVGYVSQCASFNGISSKITAPQAFNGVGDFSFVAWFNTSHTGSYQDIISERIDSNGNQTYQLIFTRVNISNKLDFGIRDANNNLYEVVTNNTYTDGKWHFVVFYRKGSDIYINVDNGKEIVSITATNADVVDNNNHLTIGSYDINNSSAAYFNGKIGLVRVYNRVLTEQEIQALYQEGLRKLGTQYIPPRVEDGLVSAWDGDVNGTTWYDSKGNNNGTATDVSVSKQGLVNVMSFNGSSSLLSIPKTTMGIIGTQDFYVSGWYYLVDPGSGNNPLLFGSFQSASPYIGPIIFFDPYNRFGLGNKIIFQTTINNRFSSNTTASLLYNSWHHIVITRISGTLYLYIDGVLDNSGTDNTNIGAADEAYICRNSTTQRRHGKTVLVRVGVGKGLIATEIQQLYKEGLSKLYLPNYSIPNLEQGKVLEISRPQVGGTYYDQTGNGNNGTATNVSDSTVGKANVMSFNGSSSYINIGNKFNATNNMTVNVIYKVGTLPPTGGWAIIIGKTQNNATNYNNVGWSIGIDSYGNLRGGFGTGNNYTTYPNVSIPTEIQKYNMVTIVSNGDTKLLYFNGVKVGEQTISGLASNSLNTLIGSGTYYNHHTEFNGEIINPQIYNRALSEKEIQQLYYSQKGNFIS